MKQLITLNQLISKYLMILIIGFSCIAYIVPSYFSWAIAYTPFLLGIAMFGMGLTIKFEDLYSILRHPKDICIGVLAQYTFISLGNLSYFYITSRFSNWCHISWLLSRWNRQQCHNLYC